MPQRPTISPKSLAELFAQPPPMPEAQLSKRPFSETNPTLSTLEEFALGALGLRDPLADDATKSRGAGALFGLVAPLGMAARTASRGRQALKTGSTLGALASEAQPITAYHGSPYDFDKFSLEKIGTGEGAQAYGHGLYFAENQGVARDYQRKLAKMGSPEFDDDLTNSILLDGKVVSGKTPSNKLTPLERAALTRHYEGGITQRAIDNIEDSLKHMTPGTEAYKGELETLHALKTEDLTGRVKPFDGRMYEVGIHAHPDDFLDWDKPLSQQSEKVRKAVRDLMPDPDVADEMLSTNPTGESLLRYVMPSVGHGRQGAEDLLSEALKTKGIKGVRYLDQGSRGVRSEHAAMADDLIKKYGREDGASRAANGLSGWEKKDSDAVADMIRTGQRKGTSNYVVFDDSIIDIRKKMALLLGLGSAGAASTQLPQRKQQ